MAADKTTTHSGGFPAFEAAAVIYLALHLFAAVTGSVYLWGVDGWRVMPEWGTYVLFALGIALLFPRVQDSISALLRAPARLMSQIPAVALAVVAGAMFWLFRCRAFFLGDGLLRMRNITGNFDHGLTFPLVTYEEPLDTFLHSGLYQVLHPLTGVSAQDVYQWVSILAGMLGVWLLVRFSRQWSDSGSDHSAVLFLTGGAVLLFFGYVESYTVAWVCALGAVMGGLGMIRSRRVLVTPAWWFAVAVAVHPATITIAPGIVYAYFVVWKSTPAAKRRMMLFAGAFGGMLAVWVATLTLMIAAGRTPEGFAGAAGGSHYLPLIGTEANYAVLSPAHIADMFNEVLLVLPSVLVLFLGGWKLSELAKSSPLRFLVFALIGPLVWLVVIDPKLGFARDWDLFSLIALPGTFLVSELLAHLPADRVKRAMIPIVGIALIHTAPWIALNASEDASFARFNRLAETPHWSDNAVAMAWESIAGYHSAREEFAAAGEEYARSFDLTGNPRFYTNVVAMYQRGADPDALARFVHSHPDNAEGYFFLGQLYLRHERPAEAAEALAKAVAIDPAVTDGYFNLGLALATDNHFTEAIDAYTTALDHDSDDSSRALTLTNRGNAHLSLQDIPAAIVDYRAAIDLSPQYAPAYFNLAFTYYSVGDSISARKFLDDAERLGYKSDDVEKLRGMME